MVNEEKSLNVLIEQYYDAYTVVLCFVSSENNLLSISVWFNQRKPALETAF
jgi:hypothetical protein